MAMIDSGAPARFISPDRLSSYLRATNGNVEAALALYDWDGRASGAVFEVIAMVEVATRNAIDETLTAWASKRGGVWFDIAPLDPKGRADVAKARAGATRNKRPEVHGKVIAEFTFGFWRYLIASRYHTALWIPALHTAFGHGPANLRDRREQVEQHLQRLHFLRNRAAHHEPLHRRDLSRDNTVAIELGSWIDPAIGTWIASRSRIRDVLNNKPAQT